MTSEAESGPSVTSSPPPTAGRVAFNYGRAVLFSVLALLALFIGYRVLRFSALSDYFLFSAEYADQHPGLWLDGQLALVLLLFAVFAMLFYRRIMWPIGWFAMPLSGAARIEKGARFAIVLIPSLVVCALLIDAGFSAARGVWVIGLALGGVVVTAGVQSIIAYSWDDYAAGPGWRVFVVCAFFFAGLLYLWIWADVISATLFIGGIGVVLLFLIYFLLFFEALEAVNPNPEIIVLAVGVLIYLLFYGPPVPEFVNTAFAPKASDDPPPSKTAEIQRVTSKRNIPLLAAGFQDWLDERIPREKRLAPNRKYPVFIVAAQGGGQYAAYHAALSLARLYDSCPKLKDHVFAISGVSGGSVGAAVISQLLHSQPALAETCSDFSAKPQEKSSTALEAAVNKFFEMDLVTPVIATGLLFDLPALVSPFPRSVPDRARTLELAIDNALGYAMGPSAKSNEFYSSWTPRGIAPALFLNTTTANYGRPILLSQLYMADNKTDTAYAQVLKSVIQKVGAQAGDGVDKDIFVESLRASEYSRPPYFNILQYRGDIQLSLATAAVLSARFPFVTPPGVLYRTGKKAAAAMDGVAIDTTLNETKALQLIDGGFSDNSGIATANEIIKQLKAADTKQEYASKVEFHLISFGHSNSALQLQGERDASPEFIAPFSTFEAVREARSLVEADAKTGGFDVVHGYHLFDSKFQAPLSWTLSKAMRAAIDDRSGGVNVKPFVCCSLSAPEFGDAYPEIVLDVQKLEEAHQKDFSTVIERLGLKKIAPNVRQFESIIRVVRANLENSGTSPKEPGAAK